MKVKSAQRLFVPVLLLILAYEWLVSCVNKLLVKNYFNKLHDQMAQSVSGIKFKPYATLINTVGLHQVHTIGTLVIIGEFFVGFSFVVIAFNIIAGKIRSSFAKWGIVASVVAAFMSLNYALLGGDTLFVDPDNAFQEGISVDWMLFFIEIALTWYFASHSKHANVDVKNEPEEIAS